MCAIDRLSCTHMHIYLRSGQSFSIRPKGIDISIKSSYYPKEKKESKKNLTQEERCLVRPSEILNSKEGKESGSNKGKVEIIDRARKNEAKNWKKEGLYIRGGCSKEKKESKKNLTQEERCLVRPNEILYSKEGKESGSNKGNVEIIDRARKNEAKNWKKEIIREIIRLYIRGVCSKEKKESKKNLTQEERCLVSRDLSRYYIRKKEKKGSGGTIDRARKTGRKKDYTFALKRKERIKKESYARRKMSRE